MAQVVCCCSHHKSVGSIPGHCEDCCGESGTETDFDFSVSVSALMLHTSLLLSEGQVAKTYEHSKQFSFGNRIALDGRVLSVLICKTLPWFNKLPASLHRLKFDPMSTHVTTWVKKIGGRSSCYSTVAFPRQHLFTNAQYSLSS